MYEERVVCYRGVCMVRQRHVKSWCDSRTSNAQVVVYLTQTVRWQSRDSTTRINSLPGLAYMLIKGVSSEGLLRWAICRRFPAGPGTPPACGCFCCCCCSMVGKLSRYRNQWMDARRVQGYSFDRDTYTGRRKPTIGRYRDRVVQWGIYRCRVIWR